MRGPRTRGRVASTLAAVVVASGAWIALLLNETALGWVQRIFAVATSTVLGVLGCGTVAVGTSIVSGQLAISVVTACTGLFATGLYVIAVLLFPASWRARLVGCVGGVCVLFVVNIIRLASLYYVGVHWPSALDVVHQVVWQSLVIAIVVAMWLLWAGRASQRPERRGAS
ncbi:MAG: archaeosortase/exosortase family protein [Candidatus Bipolaricaulota bacterium]|nr:archaeosortase/exosortase family protein [Candidatus Bipolaricaulota bacterium]